MPQALTFQALVPLAAISAAALMLAALPASAIAQDKPFRPVAVKTPDGLAISVQDWGNPDGPGIMTWEAKERRFWATNLYDTEPGPIRAFRMYYSLLL